MAKKKPESLRGERIQIDIDADLVRKIRAIVAMGETDETAPDWASNRLRPIVERAFDLEVVQAAGPDADSQSAPKTPKKK